MRPADMRELSTSGKGNDAAMPMIQVYMLQGRTNAQKRQLIEAMTNVMVEVCGSKPERVGVIVNEIDPANWGRAGVPHSESAQAVSGVSK